MFQFSAFAPNPYAFRVRYPCGWVAPFGHPRISAWLPAPLGFSQVPASFIASRRQDIHRVPLWPDRTNQTPRLPRALALVRPADRLAFQPQAFSITQLRSTSRFNFAQLAPNAPRTRSIEPRPNVRSRHSSLIRLPKSGLRRGSIRCGAEQSEPLFRASGSPKREGTIAHHAFESSRLPLAFHPPPPPPPSSSSRSRRPGCSPGLNAGGPASDPLPNRPRT